MFTVSNTWTLTVRKTIRSDALRVPFSSRGLNPLDLGTGQVTEFSLHDVSPGVFVDVSLLL